MTMKPSTPLAQIGPELSAALPACINRVAGGAHIVPPRCTMSATERDVISSIFPAARGPEIPAAPLRRAASSEGGSDDAADGGVHARSIAAASQQGESFSCPAPSGFCLSPPPSSRRFGSLGYERPALPHPAMNRCDCSGPFALSHEADTVAAFNLPSDGAEIASLLSPPSLPGPDARRP